MSSDNRVTLCGRKFAPCCPQMYRTADGMVGISDDYGNAIKIPVESARMLADGLDTIQPLFEEKKPLRVISD